MPYRRGYLLYGPPGTGKTSFVLAIAAALKLSIFHVILTRDHVDDDQLNRIINNAPMRSIILIEDIDSIFVKRSA